MRGCAVELLGEVKAPGARERLLEVLADPRDPARGAAARGLGRLGDAAEGLLALGTASARARVAALRLSSAEARAELVTLLAEPREAR